MCQQFSTVSATEDPQPGTLDHILGHSHHVPTGRTNLGTPPLLLLVFFTFYHFICESDHRPPIPSLFAGFLGTPSDGRGGAEGLLGKERSNLWKRCLPCPLPVKVSGQEQLGNQAWGPTPAFPQRQTLSPTWRQAHDGKGSACETQP